MSPVEYGFLTIERLPNGYRIMSDEAEHSRHDLLEEASKSVRALRWQLVERLGFPGPRVEDRAGDSQHPFQVPTGEHTVWCRTRDDAIGYALPHYERLLTPDQREAMPYVERCYRWGGEVVLPAGRYPMGEDTFHDGEFAFPVQAVAEILNGIAREGWQVLDVSEDRGLFPEPSNPLDRIRAQSDAVVTRARYLLCREQPVRT